MQVWRLHGEADLRLEQAPVPEIGPDELLIRVGTVGICGSDVHYFEHGRCGSFIVEHPFILGHEFMGRIAAVGGQAGHFEIDQRVAIDPSRPCGQCVFCQSGRSNLCRSMRYFGTASVTPHADGAYAEYVTVPARNCHPLPESISDPQAAVLEPMSIALHAVRRCGGVNGQPVLITGGGPIGQLIAMVARAEGATWIGLSDLRDYPRQFASARGVDAVFNPAAPQFADQVAEQTNGGPQIIFECSGAGTALTGAIESCAVGGTIVQVGTLPETADIPANRIMTKELAYLGSFRFADTFGDCLEMIVAEEVDVSPLVTDVFEFADLPRAMDKARSGEAMKVQVRVDSD